MIFLLRFNTIKLMPKSLALRGVESSQLLPAVVEPPTTGGRPPGDTVRSSCVGGEDRLSCSSSQLCQHGEQQLCSNSSSQQLCIGYLTLPRSKVMSDNILLTSPKTKVGYLLYLK
jgi:hypothetical protein